METKDLLKKVRKIEIKSKGLSNQIFSGEYHSAFKGRGMAFSEVRAYNYGDDIRNIDWNVTARFNEPFIKVFEEERELTVMLLIDVSGSNSFGSTKEFKSELIAEIAAVLSFSAIKNNDKVGLIFFSDKVEKFIPPRKGTTHILRIIREIIDFKPESRKTDISVALKYLINIIKKKCTAFVLSDFHDKDFSDAIFVANKKHDIVAMVIKDKLEENLPEVGMLKMINPETNTVRYLDTSSKKVRKMWKKQSFMKDEYIKQIFLRAGVDAVSFYTDKDYIKPLKQLFNKREARY